ncbi:hypothetical protein H6P81_003273 [Aristolochia fimbriata]|uniref:BHLH domain-containing protein n=1 Tax=Aristolochia fimbriata TaxID=158543 RepID=A0AAV7FC35_ARIFI|nr:hypothetical protein H6P81_003273 [Aristolochia fimbriata]
MPPTTTAMAAHISHIHEEQQQGGGFGAHGINIISNPPANWETITPFSDDSSGGTDRKYSRGKIIKAAAKAKAKAAESKYCSGSPPAKRGRNYIRKVTTAAAPADLQQNQYNSNNNNNKGSTDQSSDHEIHIWTERERRKKMRNMFSTLHALLPHLPTKADKSTIVDEAVNYIKSLQHSLEKLEKQKQEMNMVKKKKNIVNDEVVVVPDAAATDQYYSMREAYMEDFKGCSNNWAATVSSSHLPPTGHHLPHDDQYKSYCSFHTWSSPNVILSVSGEDAHISLCASTKLPGLLPTIFYILEKHTLQLLTAHISSDYFRTMYMIHVRAINGVSDHLIEPASAEEIFKLAVGEIILWLSP